MKSQPFLDYAVHQLSHHLKACNEDLTTDMVLRFLGSPGSICSWVQIWYHDHEENGTCSDFDSYPKECHSLHIASVLGHLSVLHILLDRGADSDISIRDSYGQTALHNAAFSHDAVVELLIEKGADCSARDKAGQTALHHAAHSGNEAVVRLLLKKGTKFSDVDNKGDTPLHRATWGGFEGVARLLLEEGANFSALNYEYETALHIAANLGYDGVVRLLLEKGTNASTTDINGYTPLQLAAWGDSKQ